MSVENLIKDLIDLKIEEIKTYDNKKVLKVDRPSYFNKQDTVAYIKKVNQTNLFITNHPQFDSAIIGKKSHSFDIVHKNKHLIVTNIDTGTVYSIYCIPKYFTNSYLVTNFQ